MCSSRLSLCASLRSINLFASSIPSPPSESMSNKAELLCFEPVAFLLELEKKGMVTVKTRRANLAQIKKVAAARLPRTVHVPKSRRKRYQLNETVWTACDNFNEGCKQRVSGADTPVRCAVCKRGIYCSEKCRDQHIKEHESACVNTASEAVSRLYDELVAILDDYYAEQEDALIEGLPTFHYLRPLSLSNIWCEPTETRNLANIELWLSFVIFKEMMSTRATSGPVRCMTCNEPTPLDDSAAASVVVGMNDFKGDGSDEKMRSFSGASALGDIPELMKIEFLGVEKNTVIHGRYRVCCSDKCHADHTSLFHRYGTFDFWKTVLSGMVKIHITSVN